MKNIVFAMCAVIMSFAVYAQEGGQETEPDYTALMFTIRGIVESEVEDPAQPLENVHKVCLLLAMTKCDKLFASYETFWLAKERLNGLQDSHFYDENLFYLSQRVEDLDRVILVLQTFVDSKWYWKMYYADQEEQNKELEQLLEERSLVGYEDMLVKFAVLSRYSPMAKY